MSIFENTQIHAGPELAELNNLGDSLNQLMATPKYRDVKGESYGDWHYQRCFHLTGGNGATHVYVLIGGPHPRVSRNLILVKGVQGPRMVEGILQKFISELGQDIRNRR